MEDSGGTSRSGVLAKSRRVVSQFRRSIADTTFRRSQQGDSNPASKGTRVSWPQENAWKGDCPELQRQSENMAKLDAEFSAWYNFGSCRPTPTGVFASPRVKGGVRLAAMPKPLSGQALQPPDPGAVDCPELQRQSETMAKMDAEFSAWYNFGSCRPTPTGVFASPKVKDGVRLAAMPKPQLGQALQLPDTGAVDSPAKKEQSYPGACFGGSQQLPGM